MKSFHVVIAVNTITIFIFFLILSYSVAADASRPLHGAHITPTWKNGLTLLMRAKSGPSKRGKGH
ncbi:hypothetical protein ACHQM5_025203 [Ranunculus cassubicifolius]